MAKQSIDSGQEYQALKSRILQGDISPVYLLFGKEHYYIESLCDLLTDTLLPPEERDFGQLTFYGSDTPISTVISAARQFPMMVSRQVVVLKEAQMISKERGQLEDLEVYFDAIMPSTVLIICYKTVNDPSKNGKSIDKRTSFYKKAQKVGTVFESNQMADYNMHRAIRALAGDKGLAIDEVAANLLAEYTGTDLQKVEVEISKLMKVLPEGCNTIKVEDIENNLGMSRDYSTFELCKALSIKDREKCFKITRFFANSKRYPIQMIIPTLASHFFKILKIESLIAAGERKNDAYSQAGVPMWKSVTDEYDLALANYPIKKVMGIINLLKEYDYRSKSNARGEASDGDLLTEMITKIL